MKNIKYFIVLAFFSLTQLLTAQDSPVDFRSGPLGDLNLTFTFNFPSCPGVCDAAVYLEADGGVPPYSYLWFNGLTGTEYLNACPGIGSVTVTDAVGNTAENTFYAPDPIVPIFVLNLIITQPTNGQNNGSIALDSSGVVGHPDPHWSLDSINFNPYYIFSNLGPGTYHLYIYVELTGCIYRATEVILFDITDVEDLNISFQLFPNPVATELHLNSDIPLSVEITDLNGRKIFSELMARDHVIHMADYPDGIYILKISDGEKSEFQKIIKSN